VTTPAVDAARQTIAARGFARWLSESRDPGLSGALEEGAPPPGAADIISLAAGLPAPELFPLEALSAAFARAFRYDGPGCLQYGSPRGLPALRVVVCQQLAARGVDATPDEVMITTGSSQALDLLGRVLLDAGDTVAVEAPTFPGALDAWRSRSPRFLTVPLDDEGLVVEALEEALRTAPEPPRFVYTLPTFQNPAGVCLSAQRRMGLLELSAKHNLLIVEDDPYFDLWYDQPPPPPPIRALTDARKHVIYVGSFSKILAPGLRLGFVVADRAVMKHLLRAKAAADLHSVGIVQSALLALYTSGDFDVLAHRGMVRDLYRARRDAVCAALEDHVQGGATWRRPRGGFFVWLELAGGVRADSLMPRAKAAGVSFLSGRAFYPYAGGEHALRLSFAHASPPRLICGVQRLAQAIAG
jgi:2-aminoadipate transaminase